jgi:hypothetical protein
MLFPAGNDFCAHECKSKPLIQPFTHHQPMFLRIFQTGHEQFQWLDRPSQLDPTPPSGAQIQIICEDDDHRSVSFTGHLLVRTSPDGSQMSINVQLYTSPRPAPCPTGLTAASKRPVAISIQPAPVRRSLCIPLPGEAVSRLRLKPGQPQQFELRLRNVRIDFLPHPPRPDALRSERHNKPPAAASVFATRTLLDAPEDYALHGNNSWHLQPGQ